jgi:hypothetical protein
MNDMKDFAVHKESNTHQTKRSRGKVILSVIFCALCWCGSGLAADRPPDSQAILRDIGPDRKVWAKADEQGAASVQKPGGDSESVPDRNVVEIETGMNYWNGMEWAPSDATFDLTDDSFVATRLQYKLQLFAELNTRGAVTMTTRDNVVLKSTPVAIGLYDAQSGKSLIISAITNVGGVLVRSNVVVYENAFTGVAANVVYTINKGSVEQDVVITGNLSPADYGFPTNTTRVQIYTEFFDTPNPERLRRPLRVEEDQAVRNSMATPDLVDDVLEFGECVFGTGRASLAGLDSGPCPLVAKEFVTRDSRTFLIESVDYIGLYPQKNQAASTKKSSRNRNVAKVSIPRIIPRINAGQMSIATPKPRKVAMLPTKNGSIVVDYIATIGPGFSTPTTFLGDTTYLVTGTVTCSSPTTIEGGTVFKYKPGGNLQVGNTLTTTSSAYRPIIFTAVDDDSVGETMNSVTNSGYTGFITNTGYADPAMQFNTVGQTISDVRFRYCKEAIKITISSGISISHSQFVSCIKGIEITGCGSGSSPLALKNALFASVTYPFIASWTGLPTAPIQNCTIDSATQAITATGNLEFKNCIFANISTVHTNGSGITGSNNGFYSASSSLGSATSPTTTSANPFSIVKGGSYYLASSCPFRNIGTTSIDSGLATDLKKRTDYGPVVLTTVLTGPLYPSAARDSDVPDLGYHYDPLDYIGRELTVTADGNPLILTNGVAIAFYGNHGIQIPENGAVISQGTPIFLNRFVWYTAVQEQPILLDNISTRSSALFDVSGATSSSATKPILQFRFTDFPMQGLRQDFFKNGAHPLNLKTLLFQDSWLRGANLVISGTTTSFGANTVPTATFINDLFERATVSIFNGYVTAGGTNYQNPITVTAYNGLFFQGTVSLTYNDLSATTHPAWTLRDNIFDHGSVSLSGDGSYQTYVTRSFDGFFSTTGSSQLSGTGDVTLTALTYSTASATGWRWYQNTRTPTLHDVDTGRTGAAGGLYHYTTKASEGKETTSAMDLGFHYVVLNASNLPVDTDGDGMPDYLEDTNGDGDGTNDGTNWNSYDSPDGLSGTSDLRIYTPLK